MSNNFQVSKTFKIFNNMAVFFSNNKDNVDRYKIWTSSRDILLINKGVSTCNNLSILNSKIPISIKTRFSTSNNSPNIKINQPLISNPRTTPTITFKINFSNIRIKEITMRIKHHHSHNSHNSNTFSKTISKITSNNSQISSANPYTNPNSSHHSSHNSNKERGKNAKPKPARLSQARKSVLLFYLPQ